MPPHELPPDLLAGAAGDSEFPLLLDVEVEEYKEFNGRYRLCEDLYNGAPQWRQQRGGSTIQYSLGRWRFYQRYDALWSSRCSASTPPQDVEGLFHSNTHTPVTVRISVPELAEKAEAEKPTQPSKKRTDRDRPPRARPRGQAARPGDAALAAPRDEAARLTAQQAKADAAEAKANAERLREAARGADELRRQLEAERAASAGLKKQLAAAQRDAAQQKGDCDALRAAAEQTAEKLAELQLEAKQVAELKGLLAVLSEDLTKAEAAAAPPRGAVARYYNRYADSIEARTPTQVSAFLWNLLLLCAEIPGAGPESEFVAMHQRLIKDVDKRVEEDGAKGVHYGRPEAEVRVALIWSTGPDGCATYYGEPLEFSAWINLILVYRDSDRPLKLALPFVRTLNRFCVTAPRAGHADAAPGERWPGKEMDAIWVKIGRNDWNVYRGSGMSVEHKGWFIPGLVFRQPRYLATSLNLDQAEHFARERTMDGRIPVVWVVQIDKRRKCCHVNNLGSRYSMFREEAELLFPPCSVFTVRAVDWAAPGSGRTSRITIEAAPDNKDHPLDLPEAPWS